MVNSGPDRCSMFVSARGHGLTFAVPYVELSDLLGGRARRPRPAHRPAIACRTGEVFTKCRHEGLKRAVDILQVTPCFSTLSRSTLMKSCGTAAGRSSCARDLGPLCCLCHDFACSGPEGDILAALSCKRK